MALTIHAGIPVRKTLGASPDTLCGHGAAPFLGQELTGRLEAPYLDM